MLGRTAHTTRPSGLAAPAVPPGLISGQNVGRPGVGSVGFRYADAFGGVRSAHRPVPQPSTANTAAAAVSPAAHPVNSPIPPPRSRSVSMSSATARSPVGPCGWPKHRLLP
jgi:hypothetical protein